MNKYCNGVDDFKILVELLLNEKIKFEYKKYLLQMIDRNIRHFIVVPFFLHKLFYKNNIIPQQVKMKFTLAAIRLKEYLLPKWYETRPMFEESIFDEFKKHFLELEKMFPILKEI